MPPESRLEAILRLIFEAEGAVDPAGLARRAAREFEQADRDRQIYELRANMTEVEISRRFKISVRRVRQVVREQLDLRRVAG